MTQAKNNSTAARLLEIERKLNLLVDLLCGGRTPANLQIERLAVEFNKFRFQLGFGTDMLLQIESALTPQKTEAQFIEFGLPSLPDMLADLSRSISNAMMPSNPGPEIIDGDIPSLPDMFSSILQHLKGVAHLPSGDEATGGATNNEEMSFDRQEITRRGGLYSLYRLRLARLSGCGPNECGIAAAILTAAHGLNNELAGISASLAPGCVPNQGLAVDSDHAPASTQSKLDMLAAAFLSISEKLDTHDEAIGKLASILQQDGGGDAVKH